MVQGSKCWYNTRRRARRRIHRRARRPIERRLASSETSPARFAPERHRPSLTLISLGALLVGALPPLPPRRPVCLASSHSTRWRSSGGLRLAPRLLRERRQLQEVAPLILEVHGGPALEGLEAELLDDGPPASRARLHAVHQRLGLGEGPRRVVFRPARPLLAGADASEAFVGVVVRPRGGFPGVPPAAAAAAACGGEPFCAASSRTLASKAGGISVASRRL